MMMMMMMMILLYNGPLLCSFNVVVIGFTNATHRRLWCFHNQKSTPRQYLITLINLSCKVYFYDQLTERRLIEHMGLISMDN